MASSLYLALPLLILLTILQVSVLPRFPILGLIPVPLFLVVIAWGLLRGATEGAVWAFWGGVGLDLFSASPMGLNSVAMMTAVIVAASIYKRLPRSRFFMPILVTGLATIIYQLLYFSFLQLIGYAVNLEAAAAFLPTAVLHAILIIPIFWVMERLQQLFWPAPVEL